MLNIAIVGLGVVGGSFAKAFKAQKTRPVKVDAIDMDSTTLQRAIEEGVITKGETHNQTILQAADLVILTLYPDDLIEFVAQHRDDFKAKAVLTDVTGIKGQLIDKIQPHLRPDLDFIFGHPMAGRENRGYDYADDSVFHGSNYLITPTPSNDSANLEKFEELLTQLGFRRISYVDATTHDQMIAYTSQICHIIAVSLINSDLNQDETIRFVGDSYRDLTRIAKINEELWPQLFIHNKEALLKVIDAFIQQVQTMRQAISSEDARQLQELFIESTKRRTHLEEQDQRLNSH